MTTDIYNLRKIAKKMKVGVGNVYHRLNFAMKGAVDQLDEADLNELKRVLTDEHKKTIAFIDALQKKQTTVKVAS